MPPLNTTAAAFKALHVPGKPLILANVYDGISARAVVSVTDCQALATSSAAVAAAAGLEDDDLDMETNLRAVQAISTVAKQYNKPLTVDFQSGYGMQLESGVARLIDYGAVGLNLEDVATHTREFYSIEEACKRIETIMRVAKAMDVPDFVVNARADALLHDGSVEDVIKRGRAYLEAGAASIFVIGGARRGGVSLDEVKQLSQAFEGKLNIMASLAEGGSTIEQLAEAGASRVSVGSQLRGPVMRAISRTVQQFYDQARF